MRSVRHAFHCGWLMLAIALPACGQELTRTPPEPPRATQELPQATPAEEGFSSSKLQRVKAIVQEAVDKKRTAGVVVVIGRRGKIVEIDSVGKSDVQAGKPMTPDAIFRFFSMTKPITSVAAMMLCEQGRFQLDEPVSKYLPAFKEMRVSSGKDNETVPASRPITIRDLMRHTSGLSYAMSDSPVDRLYKQSGLYSGTLADMVQKLGELPLAYQPGTHFHYSLSTDVLGRLIEVVSGKPLDEFFKEHILGPLDMHDTDFRVPKEKQRRFTTVYRPEGNGELRALPGLPPSLLEQRPRFLSGGGGLVSTARDYARFCQMMLNDGELQGTRLLRAETVKEMTRNQMPPEAPPLKLGGRPVPGLGFGLGFAVRKSPGKGDGEYSWSGAASTYFWIAPKEELFVIVLQQVMPLSIDLQQALKPAIYAAIEK